MGHQMLCLSLIVLISVPQVTPLFFDLLGFGRTEANNSPMDFTEADLETLQLQRLKEIQQVQKLQQAQQLRALQGSGYGAPRRPHANSLGPRNIPLLPIEPIPLSQLSQLGVGNLGGLATLGALSELGRGRFRLLNDNVLERDGETEEPEYRGILGGLRDTIGSLMGFRRSEDDEEEEFALPTGPRMEHHIHTYDIFPPPQLPRNRPGLPFGLQALNPFIRNDVGLSPFAQPYGAAYPGGAYQNYY